MTAQLHLINRPLFLFCSHSPSLFLLPLPHALLSSLLQPSSSLKLPVIFSSSSSRFRSHSFSLTHTLSLSLSLSFFVALAPTPSACFLLFLAISFPLSLSCSTCSSLKSVYRYLVLLHSLSLSPSFESSFMLPKFHSPSQFTPHSPTLVISFSLMIPFFPSKNFTSLHFPILIHSFPLSPSLSLTIPPLSCDLFPIFDYPLSIPLLISLTYRSFLVRLIPRTLHFVLSLSVAFIISLYCLPLMTLFPI